MAHYGLEQQRAFQVLVRTSQQNNRKLHDIAAEVVRTGSCLGPPADSTALSLSEARF